MSFDLQLRAVRDLGPAQDVPQIGMRNPGAGIADVAVRQGGLVAVPFRISGYTALTAGGATAAYQSGGINDNGDRTNTAINVTVPQWTSGGLPYVRIVLPFIGPTFGIRWRRPATDLGVSVTVDGVSVRVPVLDLYLTQEGWSPAVDAHCAFTTHRDLGDGLHSAIITVPGPLSGGTQSIVLYGYMVERCAGYREPAACAGVLSNGTLTNANVAWSSLMNSQRAISKAVYMNTDVGAHVVSLQYGTTDWMEFVLGAKGTATSCGSIPFDPPINPVGVNGLNQKADANAVVNYTLFGGTF